jgi:hypothetical protein
MANRKSVGSPPLDRAPLEFVTRRAWLVGALVSAAWGLPLARSASGKQGALTSTENAEIAKVKAVAQKAGIGPFTDSHTEHFIGLGDAPAAFRRSALDVAESFSKVFLAYFRAHGFNAEFPPGRMTVITLKNADSYRALVGEATGMAVGGHYDLETNRLVMFDMRGQRAALAIPAEQVNSFALVHETAHLLSFNTGLLSRHADVPVCLSEGIATFVEPWRPRGKVKLGETNELRRRALWDEKGDPKTWIPLAELLRNDHPFDEAETEQVAYAESWLLVHYLLKKGGRSQKFRNYLDDLKNQAPNPAARIKCAEANLGPLDQLDREVRKHARELSRP